MTNRRNFLKITMLNDANYISFENEKSSSTALSDSFIFFDRVTTQCRIMEKKLRK